METSTKDIGLSNIVGKLRDIGSREKLLEERYNILGKKISLIEENMLHNEKEFNKELKLLSEEILEVKRIIAELKEKIMGIVMDLSKAATVEDYQEIKAYLSILMESME